MLALMEEFFQQGLERTNSPALLKAMLINGARSLGGPWDFCVTSPLNCAGVGPAEFADEPAGHFDQPQLGPGCVLDVALRPGPGARPWRRAKARTRVVSVAPAARALPLRVTLVWTDPPANPAAGLKLVNDLDLIVTNLDTGEVYFGNDIQPGRSTNQPWNVKHAAQPGPGEQRGERLSCRGPGRELLDHRHRAARERERGERAGTRASRRTTRW